MLKHISNVLSNKTIEMDDNMILIYFNEPPLQAATTNQTLNNTGNGVDDELTEIHYYRAILAFLLAILLYFCLVCRVWKEDVAGGKPEVIDKSLVKKRVLPHGQSQCFDERDDTILDKGHNERIRIQCCHQKDTDEVTSVLESYRLKSYRELRKQKLQRRIQNEHPELVIQEDELVLAEGGISNPTSDIVCPVCLDSFHIGEEVTWSKLQHCRHVFHYECILPWAVLGHVHCPVCREVFWSRHMEAEKECFICIKLRRKMDSQHEESVLERSRFCVLHGLILPTTAQDVAQ